MLRSFFTKKGKKLKILQDIYSFRDIYSFFLILYQMTKGPVPVWGPGIGYLWFCIKLKVTNQSLDIFLLDFLLEDRINAVITYSKSSRSRSNKATPDQYTTTANTIIYLKCCYPYKHRPPRKFYVCLVCLKMFYQHVNVRQTFGFVHVSSGSAQPLPFMSCLFYCQLMNSELHSGYWGLKNLRGFSGFSCDLLDEVLVTSCFQSGSIHLNIVDTQCIHRVTGWQTVAVHHRATETCRPNNNAYTHTWGRLRENKLPNCHVFWTVEGSWYT